MTAGSGSGSGPNASTDGGAAHGAKLENLESLRAVVDGSSGPREVIAIVNGGDAPHVRGELERLRRQLFRQDGETVVLAHEEPVRRGQLLGLLDALRHWRDVNGELPSDRVTLGIMMPGKGTRLSPLTQRLHGIKPMLPMPVRHGSDGEWLTGAAASLYTWTLVTSHLERCGFRGVAWKWGDEPQIPSRVLAAQTMDLRAADAVRFGAEVVVTEDLAANKEWLLAEPGTGRLRLQVRRRPRTDLLRRFGVDDPTQEVKAHVHVGSPAFSTAFLQEAEVVYGDLPGWLDVDGYLFEALTHDPAAWAEELERDPGLRTLVGERPDFYERARELRHRLEARRGHPLDMRVVDLGAELYWGDVGQLSKARGAFSVLGERSEEGEFARSLAGVESVPPDEWGNRLVGRSRVPEGSGVRNSVLIDSEILGPATVHGAVIVDSQLGRAVLLPGAVVLRSTALDLEVGESGFSFESVGRRLAVPGHHVHTSIPADPTDAGRGLDDWSADARLDPGSEETYREPRFGNPVSFEKKFAQMRQRTVPPAQVESKIDATFREPLRQELLAAAGLPPRGEQGPRG